MDSWAPLAPTKRFSLLGGGGGGTSSSSSNSTSFGPSSRLTLGHRSTASYSRAPMTSSSTASSSSAFTPLQPDAPYGSAGLGKRSKALPPHLSLVGGVAGLSRPLVIRILSFLSLSDLRNCALAGRDLARIVSADEVWETRWSALDWAMVDGQHLSKAVVESSTKGFENRGKEREREECKAKAAARLKRKERELGVRPIVAKGREANETVMSPSISSSSTNNANGGAAPDDDFGEFSTPTPTTGVAANAAEEDDDDGFGDFAVAPPASAPNSGVGRLPGGSFANGIASVALGAGTPHPAEWTQGNSFSTAVATPSSAPPLSFTPLKPDFSPGSRSSSSKVASTMFSYSAQAALPLPSTTSPCYILLRSAWSILRPHLNYLTSNPGAPSAQLSVFGNDLSAIGQAALLANLLRWMSVAVGGCPSTLGQASTLAKAQATSTPSTPASGSSLRSHMGRTPLAVHDVLRAASHHLSTLHSIFEGSSARRNDALRAAQHGADTDRAVRRAEADMRGQAGAIWELGRCAEEVRRGWGVRCAEERGYLRARGLMAQSRGVTLLGSRDESEEEDEDDEEEGDEHLMSFGSGDATGTGAAAAAGAQASRRASPKSRQLREAANAAADFFLERRAIFETGFAKRYKALDNVVPRGSSLALDFTPMDTFMSDLLRIVVEDGGIICRIFPADQGVFLRYAQSIAEMVMSSYVHPLLERCKSKDTHLFLRACAACFTQSLRLSDALLSIEPKLDEAYVDREKCEAVVYSMWDGRMDEYLIAERKWVKGEMRKLIEGWEQELANESAASKADAAFLTSQNPAAVKRSVLSGFKDVLLLPVTVVPRTAGYVGSAVVRTAGTGLSSLNPRRWQTSGSAKSSSSAGGGGGGGASDAKDEKSDGSRGYIDFSSGSGGAGNGVFGLDDDEEDDDEEEEDEINEKGGHGSVANGETPWGQEMPAATQANLGGFSSAADEWDAEVAAWGAVASARPNQQNATPSRPDSMSRSSVNSKGIAPSIASSTTTTTKTATSRSMTPDTSRSGTPTPGASSSTTSKRQTLAVAPRMAASASVASTTSTSGGGVGMDPSAQFSQMQLLLSLETALQVVHVNRDCLKRVETFKLYPGEMRQRVRRDMEEIAVAFFQILGEGHVAPGFEKATSQIQSYDPAVAALRRRSEAEKRSGEEKPQGGGGGGDEEDTAPVEPLVHFFELVHVGDTIQQMVEVYFDQELAKHMDRTDFLNPVVREKKRFESALDEAVAKGLNAGVDLLMGQAERILTTHQEPRDFSPEPGKALDLGPTRACRETIECLRTHCRMLVGSTDKNVLEVFNQELALRLHAIICKHLKRQIISLDGGFKAISDLNAFHSLVSSLRVPSVLPLFDALKMLGNVYIIDEPRELARIVRDANMFGGTLSPEELYEFLQARADFSSIEKAVDKEMYGFKLAEDCIIC